MYNVMLVDDEELVIKGLCDFVNWESMGYCITATANSVDEAVGKLDENQIDVILTDVKMPDKTGIDLLAAVKEKYKSTELIILSGYGEFEYAQKAMRLGALGYLTKPVNFDELKKIFKETSALLQKKMKEKSQIDVYQNEQKNRFFTNLLKGSIGAISMEEAKILNLKLSNEPSTVVRIKLVLNKTDWNAYTRQKILTTEVIRKIIGNKNRFYIVDCEVKELAVIIYQLDKTEILREMADSIYSAIREELGLNVTVGIGNVVKNMEQLDESYIQAGKALQYSIIKRSRVVAFGEIDKNIHLAKIFDEKTSAKVLRFLSLSKEQELIKFIDVLYRQMDEVEASQNFIYAFSVELVIFVGDYYMNLNESEQLGKKINTIIKEIILLGGIQEISNKIKSSILGLIREFSNTEVAPNDIVGIAKQYINEHYSEDLRLNTLADLLFIHPIYLSRLFKEKSGENYLEYVTRIRIEKAKVLLKDLSYKVYHVSERVGYESPRYFSKIFKASTGMTPKEYREKNTIL